MTSVRGGTVDKAAAMKTKIKTEGVLDTVTYEAWAKTIINAPVLIHSEVSIPLPHTSFLMHSNISHT